ncbi:MAG: NepR family anti-sigma factor [Paracoccus sp. (in: a-proteobacteria)]|nr:NepR family anti-sigma factor [Paracoccus sp. (in: a-proteobacteria)]
MTTKRDERKKAALDKQIDENLKRVYQEDAKEEVPDRFLALLQQLRDQE